MHRIQESQCSTCPVIIINKIRPLHFLDNQCLKIQMPNINLFPLNFQDKDFREEFLIILIFQCKATQTWWDLKDRDQTLFRQLASFLAQYKIFKDSRAFLHLYKDLINKASLQEGCLFIKINNSLWINYNSNKDISPLIDKLQSYKLKQVSVQM